MQVAISHSRGTAQNIISFFAIAGFLLLFPGFAFYHAFIAAGLIPGILGGFFSPVSFFLLLVFSLLISKWITPLLTTTSGYGILVVFFFVFIFAWSTLNYVMQYDDTKVARAFSQSMLALFLSITLFIVGYLLPFNSVFLKKTLLVCLVLSFLYLFYYVFTTGSIMFNAHTLYDVEVDDSVASYQGFARSALFTVIFLLSVSRVVIERLYLVSLGLFIMFVLGARSELIAFSIATTTLLFIWSGGSFKYKIFIVGTIVAVFITLTLNYDSLSESRQFQLTNLSEANSWVEREQLESIAVSQIYESPILGFFGGHIIANGSEGTYAHNVLSAWVNYGFFGFLVYLALCLVPVIRGGYYIVAKRGAKPAILLSFSLGVGVLVLIIYAKPVFWVSPSFVWGVYAGYLTSERRLKYSGLSKGIYQ